MYYLLQDIINQAAGLDLLSKVNDKFFIRLAVDIFAATILIRFIHYRLYRKGEFVFTYFMFNIMIFLITYLLDKVEMSMGAAFGLFAVFSIMRYRTEDITARDMTYLFITIAIGLICAVSKGNWDELLFYCAIVLVVTYLLESNIIIKREFSNTIQYEKIEMIRPENHTELINDLRARTGLNIHRVAITKIDFLKDTAIIRIYYYE